MYTIKTTPQGWSLHNKKDVEILSGKGPYTLGLALARSLGFSVSKTIKPKQLKEVA